MGSRKNKRLALEKLGRCGMLNFYKTMENKLVQLPKERKRAAGSA